MRDDSRGSPPSPSAVTRWLGVAESVLLASALAALVAIARGMPDGRSRALPLTALPILAFVVFSIVQQTRDRAWRRPDFWDVALLGLAIWMAAVTWARPWVDGAGLLTWQLGVLLGWRVRHRFGGRFGDRELLLVAAGLSALLLAVSAAQLGLFGGSSSTVSAWARSFGENERQLMTGGGGARISRAVGLFASANVLGLWLALVLPILALGSVALWRRRRNWAAGGLAAIVVGSVALLVRNLSRGALISGVLGLVAAISFSALRERGARRRRLAALACVVLLAVVGTGAAIYLARRSLGGGYSTVLRAKVESLGEIGRLRLALQAAGLRAVAERPWTGYGFGENEAAMPRLREIASELSPRTVQQFHRQLDTRVPPHSVYLALALDGGLPALLLFLAAIGETGVRFARGFDRWRSTTDALAGAIVAFLVGGAAYQIAYNAEVWSLALLLLGALRASVEPRRSAPGSDHPARDE